MRGGFLIFVVVTSAALPAYAKPFASYGYGRTSAAPDAVLDLRGLLPAGPDSGPLLPPQQKIVAPAQLPEPTRQSKSGLTATCYEAPPASGLTAASEVYSPEILSAAHPEMPLASLALLKNVQNGREVIVRVNDRPAADAELEMSPAVAEALGAGEGCKAEVTVRRLGAAPLAAPGGKPYRQAAAPSMAAQPVAQPISRATAEGAFLVQVGAFSQLENAEAARAQAGSAGPVAIEPVTVGGVSLYRVRLGPWASREEAEQAREAAEDLGFAGAKLTTR